MKELRRNVNGKASASTKKLAAQNCSLSLVRQLFHMGLIEASEPGAVQNKKKKTDEVIFCFKILFVFILPKDIVV